MSKTNTSEALYQYILQNSLHEHPVLAELRAETAKMPKSIMQIAPDQGQLMGLLAKMLGAKKYLEIGVFTGYSSLAMALAMGKDSNVVALDISTEYTDMAKGFWQKADVSSQIELIIDNALTSLDKLIKDGQSNSFDVAFIDADKKNQLRYYEYCYQLVRPGGLILIDNVFMHGGVLADRPDECAIGVKECNQFVYHDTRVSICMLPIADGLTLAYKKP